MKILLKNLSKKFGDVTAVHDLSVEIYDGHFFFFLGPSGCGKTTMLRMIAGFDHPTSGQIFFDDLDITQTPPNKRNIGMVFQNYALWPHMNVFKNVEYGLALRNLARSEVEDRVLEVLKMVRMEKYTFRSPNQLSGGQQQRVALARAIVIRPDVLLLDEPLSNLDAKLRLEMRDEIARIQKETRITTIYVTHDQKEALSMGDAIAVMKDGRIAQLGSPREVHREPVDSFVAGFIGETNFFHGKLESFSDDRATIAIDELGGDPLIAGNPLKGVKPGDRVIVSVRPESIHFPEAIAKEEKYNKLKGRIEKAIYLGDTEQFELSLIGDSHQARLKLLQLNPFIKRKEGMEEEIYIHPCDIQVLKN